MNVKIIPGRAKGTLCAPPSKSAAHRLLICGALAGQSVIHGLEMSEDILATLDCLAALGYRFSLSGDTVTFSGKTEGTGDLLCRESGSTLRFMIPVALLEGEKKTLRGSTRLFERPLTVYEDIFRENSIEFERGDGFIHVSGALKSGNYTLPGNVSSQFITGLLFVLPLLDGDSKITLTGDVQSLSYIDLTVEALGMFGVRVARQGNNILLISGNSKYEPRDLTVEGDWSNAAFFEALNCLGSDVTVTGLRENTLQGDRVCVKLFSQLCGGTPVISVADCPDLAPILMTVAAAKNGAVFTDTARLKIKESDRGNVMAAELAKFGADVEVEENRITVRKASLHAPTCVINAHNDHRIAMSAAILGTLYGCEISGAECVRKSLPSFFELLSSLNIEVQKMKLDKNLNILIVGLGLIGGSYAQALTKKGYKVTAITKKQSSIDYALEHGYIEKGYTEVTEEVVSSADLLIFALYPHVFTEWLEKYGKMIRSGAVVTDVTGVKEAIIDRVIYLLPEDVEFIAAHPMAGRELSGIEYSDADLFKVANYIVVPTEQNEEETIVMCEELGRELGFARITRLTPAEHDRMIAFLSQLTHCIAVSLMCTSDEPGLEKYTGDSFRDLTRIAKINDEMWSELFTLNKPALLAQMDAFAETFNTLRTALATDDTEKMRSMMRKSTERRKLFDK